MADGHEILDAGVPAVPPQDSRQPCVGEGEGVPDSKTRKLRIFWRLCKMSAEVASRGNLAKKPKAYIRKDMSSDFPIHVSVDEAISKLHCLYGSRPEGQCHHAHHFAEIISWRYVDVD